MQENRTGASKKTYVRPPGSTGHSGRVPEKSRGHHGGGDNPDSSQPEKTNNGQAQEKQTEPSNNGKAQDKQSEKTNNGKAKGQNKNDDADSDPESPADLPGNSEQGLANALNHGQGNKYGIYKKLERAGYTVDDDGDIVVGDGGSPSPAPILNGNNSRPEEHQIYYYHGDHLGSSNVLTDRFGRNYEHLEYFPYGESWVEETRSQTNLPYKFTGKELDPETGLYYFGARYYDPRTSVWLSADPVLWDFLDGERGMGGIFEVKNLSLYAYAHLNPVLYKDPDGNSTNIDFNGDVIDVNINDGDLNVYQHLPKGMAGPPAPIGTTEYIDEFVSPETGKPMTGTRIQVGKSFDPIIAAKAKIAAGMDLRDIAAASNPGGSLDIKVPYKNAGALLNGKYATSRSAGNYLAGYNAARGTYYGVGIEFETFQKMAGALQVRDAQGKDLSFWDKAGIAIGGTNYGPAPAYGENIYQYRRSKSGWDDAKAGK
jgi:RHS repeat-associated protein